MFFLTDAMENRMHRATAGELMRICGVIEPRDWVITLHTSGYLYRYVFYFLFFWIGSNWSLYVVIFLIARNEDLTGL